MFLEHFGLIEQPFGVTPDPRFLHLGTKHREALASLVYGTETNRGFLALIAKPGMGKTTLLYQYLEGLRGRARSAFLFHTEGDSRVLMRHLLLDLGLNSEGKDLAGMHDMLNRFLVEEMNAGRRFVLVIDEAQNLDERVLEFVRLLSNFETPWKKLMHIVIAGQPQLADKLAARSMEQLRQRISAIIRLEPFTAEETSAYIRHRLWIGGYSGPTLFTVGAQLLIAQKSGGIPRNINNLCFHSMSLGYALGRKQVDSLVVREAISDLEIVPTVHNNQVQPFATDRIFVRKSPSTGATPKKHRERAPSHPRRWAAAVASIAAAAVLLTGSGVVQKLDLRGLVLAEETRVEAASSIDAVNQPTPGGHLEQTPANPYGLAASPQSGMLNSSHSHTSKTEREVLAVTVQRDDTLRHLSLAYLGRYDAAALIEISSLNPAIIDPNHIEIGQVIRMPLYLRNESSGQTQASSLATTVTSQGERP